MGTRRMTRSELVARLAASNPHLRHRDAERLVDAVLHEIAEALRQGHRVELRGFGAFSIKDRAARIARDPRLGSTVQVASKRVLHFKSSKLLNKRLNEALGTPSDKDEDSKS